MDCQPNKPFEFKSRPKNKHAEMSCKYFRRKAMEKAASSLSKPTASLSKAKDKKRLRREVKLRRIHLNRYISVKYNGTKWWNKLMAIYFGHLTQEDVLNIKTNTTSDVLLEFEQIRSQSRSFRDQYVYRGIPSLVAQTNLRFLFHGISVHQNLDEEGQADEDIYQLLTYQVKLNLENNSFDECYISDPEGTSLAPSPKPSQIKVKNIQKELDMRAEYRVNASLNFVESITDPSVLYDCLLYQQNLKKYNYSHIDCQLALLPQQIEEVHLANIQLWDKTCKSFKEEKQRLEHLEKSCSEIEELQINLACKDRLLYFKRGFTDKTEDELEEALQELQLEEKRLMFSRRVKKINRLASYNDCKICFNPEVKEVNEILFCSLCHTSYHMHCYGIRALSQSENYLCDACLWMEENDLEQDYLEQRPQCSICYSRKEFPLKKIGSSFYHITCLFFFGLVKVKSFSISLKEPHATHPETVRENGERCQYCLPHSEQIGMCLACQIQTCPIRFHPICAYLRGCVFEISRSEELQSRVRCHVHSYGGREDDQIRQVYIRRFFCNFQNIQPLTEEQFKPLYQDEKHEIQIQRRKLQQTESTWEEYNILRKRTKEIQMKETNSFNFTLMTVEELLSLGRRGEKEGQVDVQGESLGLYEVQSSQERSYILID